jgi:hypothetical protein
MTFLISIIAGIVGTALGWALAFGLTLTIGTLTGGSDFEVAMLAMWAIGPIGGLAGLIAGLFIALRRQGPVRLSAVALKVPVVILTIGGLALAAGWVLYEMRPTLGTSSSGAPRLDFEIKLPPGLDPPPEPGQIGIQLNTERNRMPGEVFPDRTRKEGSRTVLAGSVELYFRSNWRLLEVAMSPREPTLIFNLKLSARPGHMPEYGPWQRVDFTAEGTEQPRPAPANGDAYELRYRVVYRDRELDEQARMRGQ